MRPVRCPKGHEFKVEPSKAGKHVRCPICGAGFDAPAAGQAPIHLLAMLGLAGFGGGAVLAVIVMAVFWMAFATTSTIEQAAANSNSSFSLGIGPNDIYNPGEVKSKLRKIGLGFHNYHDSNKVFEPPRDGVSAGSTRMTPTKLSWRVHLLPMLGEKVLYDRFNLKEPWDSPNNKPLLEMMPDIYKVSNKDKVNTRYQVLLGGGMLFGQEDPPKLRDLSDGTRHTIMVVVTGKDKAVPWTKPEDVQFSRSAPHNSLGELPDGYLYCVMGDNKVVTMPTTIEPAALVAMATPDGGEIVNVATIRQRATEAMKAGVKPGTVASSSSGRARQTGFSTAAPGEQFAVDAAKADKAGGYTESESGSAGSAAAALSEHQQTPLTPEQLARDDIGRLQAIHAAFMLHEMQFGAINHPTGDSKKQGSRLSWRVHLLPYLGEMELYNQFRFHESWDSEHNEKLITKVPKIYEFKQAGGWVGATRFRICTGEGTLFGRNTPVTRKSSGAGQGQTLLVTTVGLGDEIPWTQPGGLNLARTSLQKITRNAGNTNETMLSVMLDGTIVSIPPEVAREHLPELAQFSAGAKSVDVEKIRRIYGPKDTKVRPAVLKRINELKRIHDDRVGKLKTIGVALHSYHDANQRLPIASGQQFFAQDGSAHLSWRVHLLPQLGQQELYDQFKLNEPWDSPNNKPLLDKMPDVYRDPLGKSGATDTRFVFYSGPQTLYERPQGMKMSEVRDGTSDTMGVVICGPGKAVPWTKPADIVPNVREWSMGLGRMDGPGILHARLDGRVSNIKTYSPALLLKQLITPSGGEVLMENHEFYGK